MKAVVVNVIKHQLKILPIIDHTILHIRINLAISSWHIDLLKAHKVVVLLFLLLAPPDNSRNVNLKYAIYTKTRYLTNATYFWILLAAIANAKCMRTRIKDNRANIILINVNKAAIITEASTCLHHKFRHSLSLLSNVKLTKARSFRADINARSKMLYRIGTKSHTRQNWLLCSDDEQAPSLMLCLYLAPMR